LLLSTHNFGGTTPRSDRRQINIRSLQSYRLWSLLSTRQAGLRHTLGKPLRLRLKFEVASQARSRTPCAPVQAVPWETKAEQKLSRLAPSEWELCGDGHSFGTGLRQTPGKDSQATF